MVKMVLSVFFIGFFGRQGGSNMSSQAKAKKFSMAGMCGGQKVSLTMAKMCLSPSLNSCTYHGTRQGGHSPMRP